ncbi:MAG: hypothetical protein JKX87_07070 [Cycloclasticus sp.]|nr:hypothetical protein [Cycloclasticus sp.]
MSDYKTMLRLFIDICLMKRSASDVPDSKFLLRGAFLTYALSGTILLLNNAVFLDAVIQALAETVLLAVFVYGLTLFFSVPNRFSQSITAIYGSGALITVLSTPFAYWIELLAENDESTGLVGLVLFLIVCWSFIVMGNIIRETIQKSMTASLLLTFCYLYASYQLISFLYPVAAV